MKSRSVSIWITALVLMLCLVPFLSAKAQAAGDMTWADLQAALNKGGTVKLTNDVTAGPNDSALSVPSGVTVTLDLNGFTIDRNRTSAVNYGYVLIIQGNLTLQDSSPDESGVITGGYNYIHNDNTNSFNGGGVHVSGGTFVMEGGSITGNKVYVDVPGTTYIYNYSGCGGGVYVKNSGTFILRGGTVGWNSASRNIYSQDYKSYGGGVYIASGSFTMDGGLICGNTADYGGGVYGSFTMNGGTISGNTATYNGGGINTETSSINGGSIIGNTAARGGGVYVWSNATITMSDGTIEGNTASSSGGGVYVSGSFVMENGTISGNTSPSGAGVYVYSGGVLRMRNGAIRANRGNGVQNNGTFTMNGGTIEGNTDGGVNNSGTFNISGRSVISGNSKDGAACNVYLPSGKTISLSGSLLSGASVGVTTEALPSDGKPVPVTNGLTGAGRIGAFFSDRAEYAVDWNDVKNDAALYVDPGSELTAETVSAFSGDTVTTAISLSKPTQVDSICLDQFVYDTEALTLIAGEWNVGSAAQTAWDADTETAQAAFSDNTAVSGTIFTLTFRVSDDARGEYPVSFSASMTRKSTGGGQTPVTVTTTPGAIRAEKQFTISYDANGGEDAPESQIKIYGQTLTLTRDEPTREGYTFLGWAEDPGAEQAQYRPGGSFTKDADTTLYAVWAQITYSITYDANGGENAPEDQIKIHGQTLTLSADEPTREGFNFLGWAESPTAAQAQYYPGGRYTKDADATLYAVWEQITYTITYDANGGENVPEDQVKIHGQALTLTTSEPTREGYAFLGWAEDPAAVEARYQPGDSFTKDADTTFYAVWKQIYTISYDANGGEDAPAAQTKRKGETLTLTTSEPTRYSYTFLGWAEDPAAAQEQYRPGGSFTKDADTTLYAVWKQITYTVSYDANGGENAPEDQVKIHGQALTLTRDEPTREGYTFLGWSEDPEATDAQYLPGGRYTRNSDAVFYAVWKQITYKVHYDANGGSRAPVNQTKIHGQTLILSMDKPIREGFAFLGWAEDPAAAQAQYQPGDSYTENADLTLYAVWEQLIYRVTYNANGGENTPEDQIKVYGQALTLREDAPTREGHTFLGWAKDPAAAEPEYQPGDLYTKNADLALYAVWKQRTYRVSYDANGGENAPEAQTKLYGQALTLSRNVPTREGYTFLGWAKTADAAEAVYQPGGSYTENADVTLYAAWEQIIYSVAYDANGGENAPETQTKLYGQALTLTTNAPTREGFTFLGWAKTADAAEAAYQPGDSYTENADLTLYAVWEQITCRVSYDANGGENTPETQTKLYGQALTLTTDEPTREGFTFLGWAEDPAAIEPEYLPGESFAKDTDTILYAVWKQDALRGDFDGDGVIDSDDAIYLLRASLDPEKYPLNQSGDVNGDGSVTSDDAVYLLRHTLKPDKYPLR